MKKESGQNISIQQNLKDAGCSSTIIQEFLQLQTEGKIVGQLQLLKTQRRLLLNAVHEQQKKLDCLDHLIFKIKNNINQKE